ncbi:MAG: ABC transporter permease [Treponemataceae bacterium]
MILFLALRNLFLLRKRYAVMIAAIALGFSLITVLTSLSNGAIMVVKNKAARFFSGEVSVIPFAKNDKRYIEDPQELISYLKKSPLPLKSVAPRTISYYSDANLIFFGGKYTELLRTVGVDFAAEKDTFSRIPIIAGSVASMLEPNSENGIILSSAISEYLNAQIGDDITIQTQLEGGQLNTQIFILKAIFDEKNFFGYVSYMHRAALNKLLSYNETAATEIAVYSRSSMSAAHFAERVRRYLEKSYQTLPQIKTRQEYQQAWSNHKKGVDTLAVISTDSQLDQIDKLLNAFLIGVYFILVVFLIITLIGILNTYKVLIYERTREIGVMRAMGMQKNQVKTLFLIEAFFLSLFSAFCGFFFAFIILYIFHSFDLHDFILISMFIERGKLQFSLTLYQTLLNILLVICTVLIAALQPSHKACNIQPVDTLRS